MACYLHAHESRPQASPRLGRAWRLRLGPLKRRGDHERVRLPGARSVSKSLTLECQEPVGPSEMGGRPGSAGRGSGSTGMRRGEEAPGVAWPGSAASEEQDTSLWYGRCRVLASHGGINTRGHADVLARGHRDRRWGHGTIRSQVSSPTSFCTV